MKRNAVLDTNILMSYSNMLGSLVDEYNIILPLVVLEELDHLKTNQNPEKAKIRGHAKKSNVRENSGVLTVPRHSQVASQRRH